MTPIPKESNPTNEKETPKLSKYGAGEKNKLSLLANPPGANKAATFAPSNVPEIAVIKELFPVCVSVRIPESAPLTYNVTVAALAGGAKDNRQRAKQPLKFVINIFLCNKVWAGIRPVR